MVVYWVGMPVDKKWIRVDITRHLELIPRLKIRDLISVKKADPDDRTMKAICHVADVDARPLSNTLKRHEEAIATSANMPIDETGGIVSRGLRKKGSGGWLSKIWSGIKSVMGIAAPIVSNFGPVGKIAGIGMGLLGG